MNCKNCGKPSGYYQLCLSCYKLKENGEIILCEKCGNYYLKGQICQCSINDISLVDNNVNNDDKTELEKEINSLNEQLSIAKDKEKELNLLVIEKNKEIENLQKEKDNQLVKKCLLCDNDIIGNNLFCPKCYYKFKNKSLVMKITNCKDIELLESNYESSIVCDDGHIVKSYQEALIDNYLFSKNIPHAYESSFSIDNNKEHDLHPDFYLPLNKIYIEHWGIDAETNKDYKKTKEYKLPLYKEAGITLICTTKKDIENVNASLNRKLKFYKEGEINED